MGKISRFIENIGSIRGLQVFQIFRFLSVFITGILLAKSELGIREIGSYESLIFLSGALSFFWVSGILNALLSVYNSSKSTGKESLLFNVAATLFLLNTALTLVLIVFHQEIKNLLPQEAESFYPLIIIYIFLTNPVYLIEYIFLLQNKTIQLIAYGFVHMTAYTASVALPLFLGYKLEVSFYCLITLSLLKIIYLIFLLSRNSKSNFNLQEIGAHLAFAFPLILSLLISGSAEYIDGMLVSTHFGSDAFAIFRYGAKELPLAVLLSGALSNAFVPKLVAENFNKSILMTLRAESLKLMHILFPLTILLLLSSNYFYPILFRIEFTASATVFNIYLLLLISRVLFPQSLVLAAGKTSFIFKIALIEIAVNIVSSYLLMLKFGIIGVAIGTVIAFYTEKILLALYVYKKLHIKLSAYLSVYVWLIYSLALLVAFFFQYLHTQHH